LADAAAYWSIPELVSNLQQYSPSAQVKAAAAHVWRLKRNQRKKKNSGFGLYHCHVESGYYDVVEIDDRTKQTLFEFYLDYKYDAIGINER
jgi:hypothetical protein